MLATATLVTITVASSYACQPRPTIITWRKEKGFWQRYWSGYKDCYVEMSHDWGAKHPESEVAWAIGEGHAVAQS